MRDIDAGRVEVVAASRSLGMHFSFLVEFGSGFEINFKS